MKNARAACQRKLVWVEPASSSKASGWPSPKVASKSLRLVRTSGVGGSGPPWTQTGPDRAGPMKPVVVVLTPWIELERYETSSTYTPGARYSGIPDSSALGG